MFFIMHNSHLNGLFKYDLWDITLNNTKKWTTTMKVNLLIIEECERNWGWGFMKKIKEVWDDIYENSTMSAQTLRDNPDRLHTDTSLLELAKVRDGNEAGPEVIQIRAISIQENVWKNENNEEEIMKNINKEEDGETRLWDCVLGESCIL